MVASNLQRGHPGPARSALPLLKSRPESAPLVSLSVPPRRSAVKVLIVDDHPIVCAGIADLLRSHEWLLVIGQAADGREALSKARELAPDLIIVDINLPKLNGLALIRSLRIELPEAKVIVLSMHDPEQLAQHIIQSGARGYVCKKVASTELVTALETVAAGGTFFDNGFSQSILKHYSRDPSQHEAWMSPREREVLIAIAEGLSSKEIAARLDIGLRTVETHRERLTRKLNIHSVAGLTRFALQQGLIAQ